MNTAKRDQRKFNKEVKQMFRWAILKAFEHNNEAVSSPTSLKEIIDEVWKEMVEDGEITIFDDINWDEDSREIVR